MMKVVLYSSVLESCRIEIFSKSIKNLNSHFSLFFCSDNTLIVAMTTHVRVCFRPNNQRKVNPHTRKRLIGIYFYDQQNVNPQTVNRVLENGYLITYIFG
jgi:hypothetical protein